MCVVSNIGDYYRPNRWPPFYGPTPQWPSPPSPPRPNPNDWTAEQIRKFLDLIKQAREFDKSIGDVDCEDPIKTAWMKDIEERLTKLERK